MNDVAKIKEKLSEATGQSLFIFHMPECESSHDVCSTLLDGITRDMMVERFNESNECAVHIDGINDLVGEDFFTAVKKKFSSYTRIVQSCTSEMIHFKGKTYMKISMYRREEASKAVKTMKEFVYKGGQKVPLATFRDYLNNCEKKYRDGFERRVYNAKTLVITGMFEEGQRFLTTDKAEREITKFFEDNLNFEMVCVTNPPIKASSHANALPPEVMVAAIMSFSSHNNALKAKLKVLQMKYKGQQLFATLAPDELMMNNSTMELYIPPSLWATRLKSKSSPLKIKSTATASKPASAVSNSSATTKTKTSPRKEDVVLKEMEEYVREKLSQCSNVPEHVKKLFNVPKEGDGSMDIKADSGRNFLRTIINSNARFTKPSRKLLIIDIHSDDFKLNEIELDYRLSIYGKPVTFEFEPNGFDFTPFPSWMAAVTFKTVKEATTIKDKLCAKSPEPAKPMFMPDDIPLSGLIRELCNNDQGYMSYVTTNYDMLFERTVNVAGLVYDKRKDPYTTVVDLFSREVGPVDEEYSEACVSQSESCPVSINLVFHDKADVPKAIQRLNGHCIHHGEMSLTPYKEYIEKAFANQAAEASALKKTAVVSGIFAPTKYAKDQSLKNDLNTLFDRFGTVDDFKFYDITESTDSFVGFGPFGDCEDIGLMKSHVAVVTFESAESATSLKKAMHFGNYRGCRTFVVLTTEAKITRRKVMNFVPGNYTSYTYGSSDFFSPGSSEYPLPQIMASSSDKEVRNRMEFNLSKS